MRLGFLNRELRVTIDLLKQFVVIDIETVRNARADAYFASKVYEPAANLRDPVKIAASIEERREKDTEKAALYWWTGQVICIGAIDLDTDKRQVFFGNDEREVLDGFFDWVPKGANVIAKSGDYFDMPFMVGRALYHNLGIPDFLRLTRNIGDVNHIFGFSSRNDQATTLDNYAFGIDFPGKLAKGSDVAEMHAEQRWKDIEAYCMQDTLIAAEMLKRWLKPFPTGVVSYAG